MADEERILLNRIASEAEACVVYTDAMRDKRYPFVEIIMKRCREWRCKTQVMYLAVQVFDRCAHASPDTDDLLIRSLLACVIASKVEEPFPLELHDVYRCLKREYEICVSVADLATRERDMLRILRYRVNIATPLHYMEPWLRALDVFSAKMQSVTEMFMETALRVTDAAACKPSALAAAVVQLAVRAMHGQEAWTVARHAYLRRFVPPFAHASMLVYDAIPRIKDVVSWKVPTSAYPPLDEKEVAAAIVSRACDVPPSDDAPPISAKGRAAVAAVFAAADAAAPTDMGAYMSIGPSPASTPASEPTTEEPHPVAAPLLPPPLFKTPQPPPKMPRAAVLVAVPAAVLVAVPAAVSAAVPAAVPVAPLPSPIKDDLIMQPRQVLGQCLAGWALDVLISRDPHDLHDLIRVLARAAKQRRAAATADAVRAVVVDAHRAVDDLRLVPHVTRLARAYLHAIETGRVQQRQHPRRGQLRRRGQAQQQSQDMDIDDSCAMEVDG